MERERAASERDREDEIERRKQIGPVLIVGNGLPHETRVFNSLTGEPLTVFSLEINIRAECWPRATIRHWVDEEIEEIEADCCLGNLDPLTGLEVDPESLEVVTMPRRLAEGTQDASA